MTDPSTDAYLLLALGGLVVLGVGLWLRRAQARFQADLRAGGDPLADHVATKAFRQRFQAWLFGLEDPKHDRLRAVGRSLVSLAMVVVLGLAILWSLVPGLFG